MGQKLSTKISDNKILIEAERQRKERAMLKELAPHYKEYKKTKDEKKYSEIRQKIHKKYGYM